MTSGGAAAFSPASIPGLQLWLDASQISGLNDGDAVATWSDASGNANNATQGTVSARPTFKTNIKNGRPALQFDGVDDGMGLASAITLSGYSVFVVWSQNDATDGSVALIKAGDPFNYHYLNPTSIHHQPGTPTLSTYSVVTPAGTWALTQAVRTGTSLKIGKNGTLDAGRTSTTDWSTDLIGAPYAGGASFNLSGYVAEILIYNSGLSDANRQLVEQYLQTKWGY